MFVTTVYVTFHLLLRRGFVTRESVESLLLGATPLLLGIVPNSSHDELRKEYEEIKKVLESEKCRVEGETIKLTDQCKKYVEGELSDLIELKNSMRGSTLYHYLSEIDKLLPPSPSM